MAGDWYKIVDIAPGIHAIGEPRYHQQNWSYLICGTQRALLFDTGSYYGQIAPVVDRLTDLPLTVLPSHMHYDHLGNIHAFDRIILPDLPILRACDAHGTVTPTDTLFLGASEDRDPPSFAVSDWLPIGAQIDLGGLHFELKHTPGHSPDSVSLWSSGHDMLFAADFLYHGPLYAQTPGASLRDYLDTAMDMRGWIGPNSRILGAHGDATGPETALPPELDRPALDKLIGVLQDLRRMPPDMSKGPVERQVTAVNSLVVGPDAWDGFAA